MGQSETGKQGRLVISSSRLSVYWQVFINCCNVPSLVSLSELHLQQAQNPAVLGVAFKQT